MARYGDELDGTEAGQGRSRMSLYIGAALLGFGMLGAVGELLRMLSA